LEGARGLREETSPKKAKSRTRCKCVKKCDGEVKPNKGPVCCELRKRGN